MNTKLSVKVNKKSKADMIDFLLGHFRYYTMNSWNLSTSWANNMKLYNVIPKNMLNKAYELLNAEGAFDAINPLILEYDSENDYQYQAAWNGRSGGYLVMISGGYKTDNIFTFEKGINQLDYADGYGWKTYEDAKKLGLFNRQRVSVFTKPGLDVDKYEREDYMNMTASEIKDIVERVQRFDKLCDDIVDAFVLMCINCEVKEEEFTVIKRKMVIQECK